MRALTLSRDAVRAWIDGDPERSASMLDTELARGRGDVTAELVVLTSSALLRALSGWLTRARADLAAAERRLHAVGRPAFVPQWEQAALACEWAAGDWTAAEERSARLAEAPPVPAHITLSLRVELLRQGGRREAAERAASRLAGQPPSPFAAWALAGLDRRPATAVKRLREAAGSQRRGLLPLLLSRLAETAWTIGDERSTARAHADLRGLDRDDPVARVAGGLAGAYAAGAAGPARAAQETAEFWGLAPLAAECLTARGRLEGDRAATLRAARDRWQEIGAHGRVRELAAILDEPAPDDDTADRLTPRERELAALVEAGLTNREIAAAMRLSVKTVEAYLTRLYAKTDCESRLQLALAVSHGRIPVNGPAR